jgi:starch synthase
MEIRIMVPRFGLINERKNKLHEVVRLSGISISVGDDERPLTIKVASIKDTKLQVYFIDNEDFFYRKSVFTDSNEQFHDDNDERSIFFCKGVLETVKLLGWSPDIVHCNDWMTGLIPMYLNTIYKNDPTFKDVKSVFTAYNTPFKHKFDSSALLGKVRHNDIDDDMLKPLATADFDAFLRMGAAHADISTKACKSLKNCEGSVIEHTEEYADAYYEIYHEVMGMSVATAAN